MNDKIIERLKKLLALAGNNPSQAEAEAAMAKAQAVAIEHGIDLAMIGDSQAENETEIIRDEMEFGQRLPTVNNYVANILIKFFNVKIITSGGRNNGRKLIFVGKRDDIHTAKYIYTWLAETMVRCWHSYYKTAVGIPLSHKQSYLLGFYNGLATKMEANKRSVEADKLKTDADKNKYAVAVVNLQKKIQDFIDNEFDNLRKAPAKKIEMNAGSYSRGMVDGSNCNIAKGGIGNRAVGQLAYWGKNLGVRSKSPLTPCKTPFNVVSTMKIKVVCKQCGGNANRRINKSKPCSSFNLCPVCKKNWLVFMTFKIPVVYQMYGHVTVEADSLEDAIDKVEDGPLPTDSSYVEGSFEVDRAAIED